MANSLPNLQLLEGAINNGKRANLPADWLQDHLSSQESRANYAEKHLLGLLPEDILEFRAFHTERRKLLKPRIKEILAAP